MKKIVGSVVLCASFALSASVFAAPCASTSNEMDAALSQQLPHVGFSLSSQNGATEVQKLCGILVSETQQCDYEEGGFKSSYQVGEGYYCLTGGFANSTDPTIAFLNTNRLVNVALEKKGETSFYFEGSSLAKALFAGLSRKSPADYTNWYLATFIGTGWTRGAETTQELAEKSGNYLKTSGYSVALSETQTLRVAAESAVQNGVARKTSYLAILIRSSK